MTFSTVFLTWFSVLGGCYFHHFRMSFEDAFDCDFIWYLVLYRRTHKQRCIGDHCGEVSSKTTPPRTNRRNSHLTGKNTCLYNSAQVWHFASHGNTAAKFDQENQLRLVLSMNKWAGTTAKNQENRIKPGRSQVEGGRRPCRHNA